MNDSTLDDATRERADAVISLVDALLEEYASGEEAFSFALPRGETFTARVVSDASEMSRLTQKANRYDAMLNPKKGDKTKGAASCPERLRPYIGTEYSVITACVTVADCLIEPKLTLAECFRIAKHGGGLIMLMASPIMERMTAAVAISTEEAIQDEGND